MLLGVAGADYGQEEDGPGKHYCLQAIDMKIIKLCPSGEMKTTLEYSSVEW